MASRYLSAELFDYAEVPTAYRIGENVRRSEYVRNLKDVQDALKILVVRTTDRRSGPPTGPEK